MLLSLATPATAARHVLSFGDVKRDGGAVVLAVIHDVKVAERMEGTGEYRKAVKGYGFRLHVVEVLRSPEEMGKVIEIAYSPSGYARTWEYDEKPVEAMKALAFLRHEGGRWDLFPYPGSVVPLKDFDDARVKTWRKVIALWNLGSAQEQLEALKVGRFDSEQGFQRYCISVLRDLTGHWTGVDLTGVITQEKALSLIWEAFVKPGMPIETLLDCDNVFWNRFRGQDWYLHPARYPIFYDAVKRHIASGEQIHHNLFDYAVMNLCYYLEHAREAYKLLLQILRERVEIYKFGAAIRISLVYHAHTTDPGLRKLNREIHAKLVDLLSDKNLSIADGAAIALGDIAKQYAAVGPVPEEMLRLLRAENGPIIHSQVASRLKFHGLRPVEAAQNALAKAKLNRRETGILAEPWDAHLGKRVLVAGLTGPREREHGSPVHVGRRLLWVEGLLDWPERQSLNQPVLLTGKLTEVHDQPAFRYHPGEPFGLGMPVTEGNTMEEARQRYVLVDPAWEILDVRSSRKK